MATSNQCLTCEKGPGTCICTGCNKYFCRKHFSDHHTDLLDELDGFVSEHNDFQDQMTKADHDEDYSIPILLQIDEWQRILIEKVVEVAEQTRQQIITLLSSKRLEVMTRFRKFSDELSYLKKTEDIVEHDLARLNDMIHELKQDWKQLAEPTSIELHVEESDRITWSRLIYVEEKSANIEYKQDQEQPTKKSTNSEENAKRLDSLGDEHLQLIHNFLTDYDDTVVWQLTHAQNINRILKPKLEILFRKLGCNSDNDIQHRINDLVSKYAEALSIWKTHNQNIFQKLQPLLNEAVLNIGNTYKTENS